MRLAILTWSRRQVGGAEKYLASLIPELCERGHQVRLIYERDEPMDRERIPEPEGATGQEVSAGGIPAAIAELNEWQPDLIFTQITHDLALEAALIELAPAVFYAHAYVGMCVSGLKTHQRPVPIPCGRTLGWGCLAHYYPHRCGGLNPVRMGRDFIEQRQRLKLLKRYDAIVTNSNYMRQEYVKHGFDPSALFAIPPPVTARVANEGASAIDPAGPPEEWSLLFVGRMDATKGGAQLLEALKLVRRSLDGPIRLTFVGDGPMRHEWARRAESIEAETPELRIVFSGWLEGSELDALWRSAHLLVVPSIWPEPFGMVGPEAGMYGVPVAAFRNGGIPDWLLEGENGCFAAADPPTAEGLADAITRCLGDPARYQALRSGATKSARRFSVEGHTNELLDVFQRVIELEDVNADR